MAQVALMSAWPHPLCVQLVTGWFYLLGEEFGRRKHLRVTSQQNKPMRSLKDGAAENAPTYCGELEHCVWLSVSN